MDQDIIDFDPFEPVIIWNYGEGNYIDSEPMTEYDWEEWLDNE